ncbi:hypothetical protein FB561_2832 [Kribbella amoyensis]|uniref:Uncharacterized protein n=1 Tax=Kribbella amoyensis TaxID=996641 RepID=A0A561BS32_9ACTN|nr:hypothetical protein [Kribbella amoyensis]TWD81710.1 hypothetical protein FB561_2832 [Kribbella amoyensis]
MRRVIAAPLLAAVLLAGCAGPDQQLQDAAEQAAANGASEVGTTSLAVRQLLDHNLWQQPAGQLVEDAEKAIGKVVTGFDAEQPASAESRRTYDEVSRALDDAAAAVTATRIALGNDDLATAARQLGVLDRSAARLRELAG